MKEITFIIKHNEKDFADDLVILQAGKGRRDDSIIQVDPVAFSFLEGMFWNKYREYGSGLKIKISSSDWARILEGFEEASLELSKTSDISGLTRILRFKKTIPKYDISMLDTHLKEMEQFLNDITLWVSKMIDKEKYIYILRKEIMI